MNLKMRFSFLVLLFVGFIPAAAFSYASRGKEEFSNEVNLLVSKGEYSHAIEKLSNFLIRNPGHPIASEQLKRVYRLIQKKGHEDSEFRDEERAAIVDLAYKTLKKTSPDRIQKTILEAEDHEKRGEYILACKTYIETLSLPGLELETKYGIEKKLRTATEKVDYRLESLPDEVQGVYRNAFSLMSVGDWDSSIEKWKEYSQKRPDDREIKVLLSLPEAKSVLMEKHWIADGKAALQARNFVKARESFQKALQVNSDSQEAQDMLNKLDEAIQDVKRRERTSKYILEARRHLGDKDRFKALDLLLGALKENPNNPELLSIIDEVRKTPQNKFVSYASLKTPPLPVVTPTPKVDQERVSTPATDPVKAQNHYQRGLVYYGLRNFREALIEWQLAVKFDPTDQKAIRALERVKSDLRSER